MCVCGLDVGGRSAVVESWHSLSSVTRAYFVTLTPSPLILACSLPPHYGHPADACCIASAAILTYMYERGIDILYTAAFSISLTSPHMGKGNAGPWAALSPHAVGRETTSTAAAAQEAPPTHKAPAPCDFRKRKMIEGKYAEMNVNYGSRTVSFPDLVHINESHAVLYARSYSDG